MSELDFSNEGDNIQWDVNGTYSVQITLYRPLSKSLTDFKDRKVGARNWTFYSPLQLDLTNAGLVYDTNAPPDNGYELRNKHKVKVHVWRTDVRRRIVAIYKGISVGGALRLSKIATFH